MQSVRKFISKFHLGRNLDKLLQIQSDCRFYDGYFSCVVLFKSTELCSPGGRLRIDPGAF